MEQEGPGQILALFLTSSIEWDKKIESLAILNRLLSARKSKILTFAMLPEAIITDLKKQSLVIKHLCDLNIKILIATTIC